MILQIKWTVQYEGIHVHTFEIVILVSFDCHFTGSSSILHPAILVILVL
jgi:hypothetical protein